MEDALWKLKDDAFVVLVVGEIRDKQGYYRNFVSDTIRAVERTGARYYNEIILVTMLGTLPIRAGRAFEATRKIGKTHQNVLVFVKGDVKKAVSSVDRYEVDLLD